MRLLLDTHVWLWLTNSPEKLSRQAKRHLLSERNERVLSSISALEISIKYGLGKLPLPEPPSLYVPRLLSVTRTYPMAMQHSHALRLAELRCIIPIHLTA